MGIGAMVGAGIFALLGEASAIAGSAVYISFVIGGLIALSSAYSLGKLGAAFPSSGGIIEYLDLRRPIFKKTAAYGHFGRNEPEFTWERTDRADKLRRLVESVDLADQRRLSGFMHELNSGGELSAEARRWWINRY